MSLLNSKQLAASLGVSPATVNSWLAAGTIVPEIREGHVIRFDADKVRAQLAKRAAKKQRRSDPLPDGMIPTF